MRRFGDKKRLIFEPIGNFVRVVNRWHSTPERGRGRDNSPEAS